MQFCFQVFRDSKKIKIPAYHKTGSIKDLYPQLKAANEAGAGIFVCVNETDGKGRKERNITRVRALFVELDHGGLTDEHLAEFQEQFQPSMIVKSSPGKAHCYWLVNDCPLDKFSKLQGLLAKRFAGLDAGTESIDLPRVLRVPGFYHQKGDPFLIELLVHPSGYTAYSVEEILGLVGIDEAFITEHAAEGGSSLSAAGVSIPDSARAGIGADKSYVGVAEPGRNSALFHYCYDILFKYRGLGLLEAYAAILLADRLNTPPIGDREELKRIVQSAHDRYLDHISAGGDHVMFPPGHGATVFANTPVSGSTGSAGGKGDDDSALFPYDYERLSMAFPTSEASIADRVVQKYGHHIKYNPGAGFYFYTDIWEQGERAGDNLVIKAIIDVTSNMHIEPPVQRLFFTPSGGMDWGKLEVYKKGLHSNTTIRNVFSLLTARYDLRCSINDFEREEDAHLLACQNGVVDLRSGDILESGGADPSMRLTRKLTIPYEKDAKCPTWQYFISSCMGGDLELIKYMQMVTGYLISGDTSLQCLFIAFGQGGTGKSKYLNALKLLLGGYYQELDPKILTVSPFSSDNSKMSSLAGAIGARLCTVREVGATQTWEEYTVKALTGDDTVFARRLRKDPVQFTPRFKLVVRANALPSADQVDEALWDRFRFLPFEVKFRGKDNEDKGLEAKFKAELPGILAWAVEGYKLFQANGGRLNDPEQCLLQKAKARANAEPIRGFIAEHCERMSAPQYGCMSPAEFNNALANYCNELGLHNLSKTDNRRILFDELGAVERVIKIDGKAVRLLNYSLKSDSHLSPKTNVLEFKI